VHAVAATYAPGARRRAAVELQRVELAVRHEVAVRIDIDPARAFVDGEHAIDIPLAAADRVAQLAVKSIQIQMVETGAVAAPDEGVLVLRKCRSLLRSTQVGRVSLSSVRWVSVAASTRFRSRRCWLRCMSW
jgi:hypothetical protein